MQFLWPEALWLVVTLPLLAGIYLYVKRTGSAPTMTRLVLEATSEMPAWKRRAPRILFGLALIAIVIASARPTAVITLPAQYDTVVLAVDVSASMRATDLQPDRLGAAKAAARTFVAERP